MFDSGSLAVLILCCCAAYYVDRILKGNKPGDLPVQFPTKYQLIVSLKAAHSIGFEVPMNNGRPSKIKQKTERKPDAMSPDHPQGPCRFSCSVDRSQRSGSPQRRPMQHRVQIVMTTACLPATRTT